MQLDLGSIRDMYCYEILAECSFSLDSVGRYFVTLTAFNEISSDTDVIELFVLDRVCKLPKFKVQSQDFTKVSVILNYCVQVPRSIVMCVVRHMLKTKANVYNAGYSKSFITVKYPNKPIA